MGEICPYASALITKPGWFGGIQTLKGLGWTFPSFSTRKSVSYQKSERGWSALNSSTGLSLSPMAHLLRMLMILGPSFPWDSLSTTLLGQR